MSEWQFRQRESGTDAVPCGNLGSRDVRPHFLGRRHLVHDMVDGPAVDVALDAADASVSADAPRVVVGLHPVARGTELGASVAVNTGTAAAATPLNASTRMTAMIGCARILVLSFTGTGPPTRRQRRSGSMLRGTGERGVRRA